MEQLPQAGVVPAPPYEVCGIDFTRAILIKDGKLRNEFKELSNIANKFKSCLSQNQIEWNFIPSCSFHFGVLWEATVKSADTFN